MSARFPTRLTVASVESKKIPSIGSPQLVTTFMVISGRRLLQQGWNFTLGPCLTHEWLGLHKLLLSYVYKYKRTPTGCSAEIDECYRNTKADRSASKINATIDTIRNQKTFIIAAEPVQKIFGNMKGVFRGGTTDLLLASMFLLATNPKCSPSKASIDKGKEIQREEKRLKEKKVVSSIGFSREVDARLCLFAPFKSFESQLKLAEKDFGEGASDLRSPKRMKKIKMMKQRDEPTKKSRSVEYRWQWKGMHTIVLIELTLKIQMRTAKGYKLGEYYDTCRGTLLELRVLDVYMCCLIGKYLCLLSLEGKVERKVGPLPGLYGMFVDGEWLYQLTKFHVQRVDMV
ncbi:hypothetical protein Tco_0343446 [Tanacetum coccineum]